MNALTSPVDVDLQVNQPEHTASSARRTDHDLLEATKNGDEQAFAELVGRYQNQITNYLYRLLNDYEEAVDLAQETFVRVYFAASRYHTEFAFSTYLYRIATNLGISELRKRKRRKLLSLTGLFQGDEGDKEKEFDIPDDEVLPEAALLDKERGAVITRAIASLPEKYRLPLVLREVEEKSYDEVAQILDLTQGTLKSRLSRGRGLLREKLKNYFSEKELDKR
jgi:RNA polymerase sigma-70 factor (ECF subfamily)